MIELVRYSQEYKEIWDEFIDNSKMDCFLFKRDFMEYHKDRFEDASYIFFEKDKIVACLPGTIYNDVYYTHRGLTFGGFIYANNINCMEAIELFNMLNVELKSKNIQSVVYSKAPYIYHKLPSDEDIYALYRLDAVNTSTSISSTVFQKNKLDFHQLRKRGIKKANKSNLTITISASFSEFWRILEDNLQRAFNKKPVHSLEEINSLVQKFPGNIKLYVVKQEEIVIGGCVMFINKSIAHAQYISANEIGKQVGALDYLFDFLINSEFENMDYFDFGVSTEEAGRYLNQGLIFQKEGFGGRGVVYQTFKYSLDSDSSQIVCPSYGQ